MIITTYSQIVHRLADCNRVDVCFSCVLLLLCVDRSAGHFVPRTVSFCYSMRRSICRSFGSHTKRKRTRSQSWTQSWGTGPFTYQNKRNVIYIYILIYIYIYICIYIYIYIYYIYRERERGRYICTYTYIYMYICIHTYVIYIYIYRERERDHVCRRSVPCVDYRVPVCVYRLRWSWLSLRMYSYYVTI